MDLQVIETRTREIGRELWAAAAETAPGVFDQAYWQGQVMEWVMRDPGFKADLFRFVDLLPTLESSGEMREHIQEYLLDRHDDLPTLLAATLKAGASKWTGGLAGATIRKQVRGMAETFIIGQDPATAMPRLRHLWDADVAHTADLLGEAVLSEAESEVFGQRYRRLIDDLSTATADWPARPQLERDAWGPLPRAQVSVKVSAFGTWLDAADEAGAVSRLATRLGPLLTYARHRGVGVTVDMEDWQLHGITLALVEQLALSPELRDWKDLGLAIQAYTQVAAADLERLAALAEQRGAPLGVRLVKGAYWDYETILARQHSLPPPVLPTKAATDAQYEALSRWLLARTQLLRPAFGSHNLRSIAHVIASAQALGLPDNAYEIQMLHGMAEPERDALVRRGLRVRLYTPIGELLPGMAYLVRRLLENTANQGFLRQRHHESVDAETLLAAPEPQAPDAPDAPADYAGFQTCAPTDFTDAAARQGFAAAVASAPDAFPIHVPIVLDGDTVAPADSLDRANPADPAQLVARVDLADAATAQRAVDRAYAAWPDWAGRRIEDRAALLERLADHLAADRHALAALQCYEVAKPWREADADIAEAIDFCRYYARQARIELAPRTQDHIQGERNTWVHQGHGPAVIIAPWNFPLAILTGMSSAALVAGCPIVMKPAEQSSAVALGLYRAMMAVGFPAEVVQFLPGRGEDIGPSLVGHPKTAVVAFTGSRAVGQSILQTAYTPRQGQHQIPHVVCEMGGKNAIIIDADADLDDAVAGCLRSAFGYAGQKCSAASRIITVSHATDDFIARFTDAARALRLGPADAPATQVPPVVDREAYERLMAVHADPGPGAQVLYRGDAPAGDGLYVPPLILRVDAADHPLMLRELFGPVVCILAVDDFDQALRVAGHSDYALTGAVYSRQPSHLRLAESRFQVGNLYLNRGSTGALVGRQPFGGFRMSGTGGKAGGPGYLAAFCQQRCITENTMRRGFTPES